MQNKNNIRGSHPSNQANWHGLWVCLKAAIIHIHRCHLLLLLSPKADTLNYDSTEGKRLSQLGHCSKHVHCVPPVPKAVYHSSCHDKHNRLQWDSILKYVTAATLDHWNLL